MKGNGLAIACAAGLALLILSARRGTAWGGGAAPGAGLLNLKGASGKIYQVRSVEELKARDPEGWADYAAQVKIKRRSM